MTSRVPAWVVATTALFAFVAIVGILVGRATSEGTRALEASRAAFVAGDMPGAIRTARTAAECEVPGTSFSAEAYEQLAAIGESAELRGEVRTAAAAWQAMRSASISTASVWSDHRALRDRAEEGLVRVAGRPDDATKASAEVRVTGDALRASLTRRGLPAPWVAIVSFLSIVLALPALSSRVFDSAFSKWRDRARGLRVGLLGAAMALATLVFALA